MGGMEWTLIALVLFVAFTLVFYQLRTGVPPFPTSRGEKEAAISLLQQAQLPEKPLIYELGSGWGGLAIAIAKAFPHAHVVGIEVSPFPYWIAKLRTRKIPNLEMRRQNFYQVPLNNADAVTAYLMIKPMLPLAEKLDRELQPGTAVVAIAFLFRDRDPSSVIPGRGLLRGSTALYLWPGKEL